MAKEKNPYDKKMATWLQKAMVRLMFAPVYAQMPDPDEYQALVDKRDKYQSIVDHKIDRKCRRNPDDPFCKRKNIVRTPSGGYRQLKWGEKNWKKKYDKFDKYDPK